MKSVVITGSTRGIGWAMVMEFLKAGCQVTLSGRKDTLPLEVLEKLEPYAQRVIYIPCNVQDKASLEKLWEDSRTHWGKVDLWINNAGQNTPHVLLWETEECYTENVLRTNLLGMIYGAQVAAKGMLKQGFGAIYSMEGLGSNNMIQRKTVLYGTTKHALTYFMKGLAKELEGTGILAGRLSPGMMLTDFITKTPDGEPSEVIQDKAFQRIFNTLADHPETVAAFFIPRMLKNSRNNAHIVWLTPGKSAWRFLTSGLKKRKLI